MTKEQVLASFKKTGGLLSGHFQLTSGRHSDAYMQCAKLFIDPSESEKLCHALSKKIRSFDADMIVSPAVGGIIMGYEVARQLGIKNIFAERVNGKMTLRRGFELSGNKVIIIEDVVTTGGSVKEIINLVRSHGSEVLAVASIVDRSNGKTEFGVPFVNLLSMEVLSFLSEDCPMCKTGQPVEIPGSKSL